MKSSATLFLDRSSWDLTIQSAGRSIDLDSGQWDIRNPESLAERVAESLGESDFGVRRVALLLGSSLCLPASFLCESSRQARSNEALAYRLEELIPLTAEDSLSSFYGNGLSVFAVATRKEPVLALTSALEAKNLSVDLVTAEARLAWEQHLAKENVSDRRVVIWRTGEGDADLVVFGSRGPSDWVHLPSDQTDLTRHLQLDALAQGDTESVIVYEPDDATSWVTLTPEVPHGVEIRSTAGSPLREAAAARLSDIRRGRHRVRFDLTPAASGRAAAMGPLRWDVAALKLAMLVLLCSFVFPGWIRLRRIASRSDGYVAAQEDLFRELFPDSRLPVGVRSRMKSELGKLAGVRGESEDLAEPVSVLPSLQKCLKAIPREMRLRILSVKIEGDRIDLSGEVREFADADRLAASLRAVGFLVTAPRTNRLPEQGVSFRLVAQMAATNEGVTR